MQNSHANSMPGPASTPAFEMISLKLAPNERLIWTGRCGSVGRYVWQALPKAVIGLALIAVVLVWSAAVIHGGNNNWDHGQVVAPFAPHNVLIAMVANLWLMPPFLFLLLMPVRVWRGLTKSSYMVTDRRALIVEPPFFGHAKTRSFYPDALRSIQVKEYPDGTGDLILIRPKSSTSLERPVGFFGINKPREIGVTIQKIGLVNESWKDQPADARF